MSDIRDHLCDELHGMLTAPDKLDQQGHAKRMLLMLYRFVPEPVQQAFWAYVDAPPDFLPTWPDAPKEWNEAAKWWGYLKSNSYPLPEDQLGFWHSINKLIRFRKQPTEKQAEWMMAMVQDYRRWKEADEMDVVE